MKVASLCLGILLLSGPASWAEDAAPRGRDFSRPAPPRTCGHVPELEAAKRSLSEGDREGALRHLQRARELLAECERNAVDPEWESGATALAMAPASAVYLARSNDSSPRI